MTQSLQASSTAASGTESASRQVDFFSLPRPVQDRVVASLTGQGIPEIVAFGAQSSWAALRYLVGLACCVLALLVLATIGYGDLSSSFALHQGVIAALYCALGITAGFCLGAYLRKRSRGDYPFPLGHYLFPVGVIEVDPKQLTIVPLSNFSGLQSSGGSRFRLTLGQRQYTFPMPGNRNLDELRAELDEHRSRLVNALSTGDRRALAGLDPVRDSGFSNPLSSRAALSRRPNSHVALTVGAAVAGGVLAGAFLLARNSLAERSIYRQAVEQNSEASYRAYLERGGNRKEVTDVLLPRSELMAVSGDLQAVEKYAAEHPQSQIREAIDAVLRLELLKELQRVRAESDLAAIEAFKNDHPGYAIVEKELAQARREVFAAAVKQFEAQFSPEPDIQKFVQALIEHSEHHGPTVVVRFLRTLPTSIERADSAVRRSAYFTGNKAVPSQYFQGESADEREARAAKALVAALQSAFPAPILSFQAPRDGAVPQPEVPTLTINYKTEMSGGYTTNRPRGVYVGLGMMFEAVWTIPNREQALEFKDSSWLPPDVSEISRNLMTHQEVYEKNAKDGLERFVRRFIERVLGERVARGVAIEEAGKQ